MVLLKALYWALIFILRISKVFERILYDHFYEYLTSKTVFCLNNSLASDVSILPCRLYSIVQMSGTLTWTVVFTI